MTGPQRWGVTGLLPELPFCVLVAALLVSCERSPSEPAIRRAYVLVSVDGVPVPASIDTFARPGADTVLHRIVGRAIEFLTADSGRVAVSADAIARGADGILRTVSASCSSAPASYRRDGSRIILSTRPDIWNSGRIQVDTVQIVPGGLEQTERWSSTRVLRLQYIAGEPSVPVCGER